MEKFVTKFGGSSLADAGQFKKVKAVIDGHPARSVVVPSAPGKRDKNDYKVTDLLYMCHQLASHMLTFDDVYNKIRDRYQSIARELELTTDIDAILHETYENIKNGASQDYCASRGEYINGILLADYLGYQFVDAKELLFFRGKDTLDEEKTREAIHRIVGDAGNVVVPGFYGSNLEGEIQCFSRGGSDVTGAILADALHVDLYENWTDVSGFLVADPNIVDNPEPIHAITFRELRELSYMGANVLHEEAIFPVRRLGIPIQIKNTNRPDDEGTRIIPDTQDEPGRGMITGIAGKKDFTVISVEKLRMTEDLSFFRKLVSIFESNDVPIAHMPSAIDSVSVIVADSHLNGKLKKIIEEIRIYCNPDSIDAFPSMALVAVVGRGMIKRKGISAKIFSALSTNEVNIRMISQGSSEINVIIGIENKDFQQAIRSIYDAFYRKGV